LITIPACFFTLLQILHLPSSSLKKRFAADNLLLLLLLLQLIIIIFKLKFLMGGCLQVVGSMCGE
jgi:hypothetical protein